MASIDARSVGQAVSRARHGRGMSLNQLSSASGVSKAALVNLEAGSGNPTLGTLASVADALAVSVSDLVGARPTEAIRVVDSADVEPLWRDDHGSSATLLFTTGGPAPAEVWLWKLAAGVTYRSQPHPGGISESVVVNEGRLALTVGTSSMEVPEGAGATFDASEPHAYGAGERDCTFTMTVHLRPVG